jgi:ankyrin repeat domain-containing protein 50
MLGIFLEKLSFPEKDNRLESIHPAHPATYRWIPNHPDFTDPGRLGHRLYWIQGKPGSGKSTIMKYISEQSSSISKSEPEASITISFFFNARGAVLESSMEGFIRSCLFQILQARPRLYTHIQRELEPGQNRRWSFIQLNKMFRTIINRCISTSRLCIFIDALDECSGMPGEILTFLQDIAAMDQSHPSPGQNGHGLQICISSRPESILVERLRSFPKLVLEDYTSVDISVYVDANLGYIASQSEVKIFQEFREDIIHKANGVFLWVALVVEELLQGWEEADTVAEIRKKLSVIPGNLQDFFNRMVQKIKKPHISDAIIMLNCIMCAIRPITLTEFRLALAFGSQRTYCSMSEVYASEDVVQSDTELEKRIRSRCCGLLEVAKPHLTVQLIHQTVIDFLLPLNSFSNLASGDRAISYLNGHQYMLRACLQYLSISELKSVPGRVQESPEPEKDTRPTTEIYNEFGFLEYSLNKWMDHYRKAEAEGKSQSWQLAEFSSPSNQHFSTWYRIYCLVSDDNWDGVIPPFVSFASENNLLGYIRESSNESDITQIEGGEFGWPLQAAVVGGNLEMVRLLLDNGADIDAVGGRFGTAMAAAITLKKYEIINLLRERGANIELAPPQSPNFNGAWVYSRSPVTQSRLRLGFTYRTFET